MFDSKDFFNCDACGSLTHVLDAFDDGENDLICEDCHERDMALSAREAGILLWR